MKIVFATLNKNKVSEINNILPDSIIISGINDLPIIDLPETGSTLTENALQKARFVYNSLNVSCFADDTGLEIDTLNGQPGVYSARFAGEEKNPIANMQKVLDLMCNKSNRNACFKTVIALIINGKEFLFEGRVDGIILEQPIGNEGFGYDPIFLPNGYTQSFAQMPLSLKNQISHRALAVKKMVDFLKQQHL